MSSISEQRGGRDGSRRGINGIFATRLFLVTVDTDNEDPLTVLIENGVSAGKPHVWPDYLAFAQDAILEKQLTKREFLVRVDYGPPVSFVPLKTAFPGWFLSVRSASFPERILKEPPVGGPQKVIGPPIYYEDSNGPFTAEISTGDVKLNKRPKGRKLVGFDIEVPMVAMDLHRQVTRMPLATIIQLPFWAKRANAFQWHGFPKRHVYFDGAIIDERFGISDSPFASSNESESLFYDVQLSFLIRGSEWTPELMIHTYQDNATGELVAIQDDAGNDVEESFHRMQVFDFTDIENAMLRLIGLRQPVARIRGR